MHPIFYCPNLVLNVLSFSFTTSTIINTQYLILMTIIQCFIPPKQKVYVEFGPYTYKFIYTDIHKNI